MAVLPCAFTTASASAVSAQLKPCPWDEGTTFDSGTVVKYQGLKYLCTNGTWARDYRT